MKMIEDKNDIRSWNVPAWNELDVIFGQQRLGCSQSTHRQSHPTRRPLAIVSGARGEQGAIAYGPAPDP
jgi:hypothetical protein